MRITDYDTVAYGSKNIEKKESNELLDLLDSTVEIIEIRNNLAEGMIKTNNVKEIMYCACESLYFFLKDM